VVAGDESVLVHNCDEPWMAPNSYTKVERDHGPNSTVWNKGRFDEGVDYDELADNAAGFEPRAQSNGRCNRVCTLPNDRTVGVDQNGLPTKT
jgi:hypothetical protein